MRFQIRFGGNGFPQAEAREVAERPAWNGSFFNRRPRGGAVLEWLEEGSRRGMAGSLEQNLKFEKWGSFLKRGEFFREDPSLKEVGMTPLGGL